MTLIHLIGIPVTNLSVNPARSTGLAYPILAKEPEVEKKKATAAAGGAR